MLNVQNSQIVVWKEGILTCQNLAISKQQFECLECSTFDFGHLELFGNCDGLLLL